MGLRLERAIGEVERIDRKILMYQNQKKEAEARLRQIENEEIIRSVRSLKMNRTELAGLLRGLQEGTVRLLGTDADGRMRDGAAGGAAPAGKKEERENHDESTE
ncbi:MAG: DUF4315 family protein [Lachnospiraceae bacterium]|nr:DUF4315 family protein [Lachnospiraceae bacterium]